MLLGNSHTLLPAQTTRSTLVSADMSALMPAEREAPEGWLLTVDAIEIDPAAAGVPAAVVYVQAGAGGNIIEMELSACPGTSIALPTGDVRVNLGWDPELVPPMPRKAVRVDAVLRRGSVAGSVGRRHYYLPLNSAPVESPVPPFARRFGLLTSPDRTSYTTSESYLAFSPWLTGELRYSAARLASIAHRGELAQVPWGAQRWRWTNAPAEYSGGGADQELGGAILGFEVHV